MEFKRYRHFQRYREIAQILVTNGLGFVLDRLDLAKYLPFKERFSSEDADPEKRNMAVRLRLVLEELGPTYIKMGQLMSTRADILPPNYIRELRKLQDEVPPLSFVKIEEVIKKELGDNYKEYFEKIDSNHRAVASIAQTHHAVLKSGQDVILKVQRPHIKQKISTDMEILKNLARMAEERGVFPGFVKPTQLVQEFEDHIRDELNFELEINNIEKFGNNFRDNSNIIVPEVYNNLSSRRLIVMEEIKGIKLNELTEKGQDVDVDFLAEMGAKALMKQILIDGFFHADPHPGNIYIVDKNKLAFIDFGLMGRLTEDDRNHLTVLFVALLHKKVDIIIDIMVEIGVAHDNIDMERLKLDIGDLLDRYYDINFVEIDFMVLLDEFMKLIYRHHIRLPEQFYLLARAFAVSEGVGLLIKPSFKIVKVGNEFLSDLIRSRIKPENIIDITVNKLWNLRKVSKNVPDKLVTLLNKVTNDELAINFRHQNLENLIDKLDIFSNRLSISLIIAALIIGSSMILQIDKEPLILNIPVLGLIGYIIAGIFGFWLVFNIFRSGKF